MYRRGKVGSRRGHGFASPLGAVVAEVGVGGRGLPPSVEVVELLRRPCWIPMRAERAARAETRLPVRELTEYRAVEARELRDALERTERFERAETVEASDVAEDRRKKDAWMGVAEGPASDWGGGGSESGRAGGNCW